MSHQKISELLGIQRPTVSKKHQQAIEQLRGSLAKAGVAAVVPLVSAENIYTAMATGYECPPPITERMLKRIDSAGSKALKSVSGRIAATRRGVSMPIATGVVVLSM